MVICEMELIQDKMRNYVSHQYMIFRKICAWKYNIILAQRIVN